jgi:hypothetical protein
VFGLSAELIQLLSIFGSNKLTFFAFSFALLISSAVYVAAEALCWVLARYDPAAVVGKSKLTIRQADCERTCRGVGFSVI